MALAEGSADLKSRSRVSRGAFAALGCFFVGMGIIGVFVPVWPTTIFCILALWCFKRSSQKLEDWLLSNRLVGPTLRDWEESKSMTLRAKCIAIGAIWLCITVSILLVQKSWVKIMLLAIAAALTWYLASRPTKVRTAVS
jgi:uncharacterized membrane protein YbaN (DUF454 family)